MGRTARGACEVIALTDLLVAQTWTAMGAGVVVLAALAVVLWVAR